MQNMLVSKENALSLKYVSTYQQTGYIRSSNIKNGHITHTHPFNGPFSGTTRVSQYQKGKTNLDFTEARDSE